MCSQQSNVHNVLMSGGTGFIGTVLTNSLEARGYSVKHLVRSTPEKDEQIRWNPAKGEIDQQCVDDADIVINLAGASIAGGWWTEKRKKLIMDSRVDSTTTIAEAIARSTRKPQVFISTSATGYYGDRPGEQLTETSDPGNMFMSEVCVQWEAAAKPAEEAGVRTVHPRLGVVFSGDGGMLPLISLPFKFALGGKIGGDQHMAWIDLHDLLRIFDHVIDNEQLRGPVNAVAPESVTNEEFTKEMGSALNRPAILPVPKRLASLAGGQLARELLLADQDIRPQVLEDTGFTFDRPSARQSLQAAFGK